MSADCTIIFKDNPSKTVYGGQKVAGIVDLNVHSIIKVRSLTLYIEGTGVCSWNEVNGGGDDTSRETYRGNDQYLNTIATLIPNETEIQPGHYSYNFTFQVPKGAPSSVEEKYGSIEYKIRVVFNRSWNFNLNFESRFTVIEPIDLNLLPELNFPLQREEIKTYCCWFCKSKPIILTASIPQIGYVVGERIPIKVYINNPTSIEITHIEIQLKKHVEFTSQSPRSKHNYSEAEILKICQICSVIESQQTLNVDLRIPHTVPSSNNGLCTVMKVYYKLNVTAKTSGCHMSPFVELPIFIGTIPISENDNATNKSCDIGFSTPSALQGHINQNLILFGGSSKNDNTEATPFKLDNKYYG